MQSPAEPRHVPSMQPRDPQSAHSSPPSGYFEEQYRTLLEELPNAVFVIDPNRSTIVDVNAAACRLVGYDREALLTRLTVRDLHPHDLDTFQSFSQRVGADGSGSTEKLRCMTASGRVVPIDVHAARIAGPDGRPLIRAVVIDVALRQAVQQALEDEVRVRYEYEEIVGRSPAWQEVLRQVDLVSATDSAVLITGETGTGKELVARALHHRSRRNRKPLIRLNCAAIPAGLVESELFGHEKGAFTGALSLKRGRFELAHEGTMFLDEIGDLPLEVQPKLLRVLQEREFERVGGQRTLRVDIRLIAATNRDLAAMAGAGRFRDDLLYRINVFPIQLPPLRERRADIASLAAYFAARFTAGAGRAPVTLTPSVLERLQRYDWPGNVRELANVIERRVFGDAYYGQLVAVGNRLSDRLVGTPITAIQTALVGVDDVASSERAHAISSVFTASRCDRLYLVLCGAVEPRRELADVEALKGAMMLIRLLRDAGVSVVVGFCSSDVVLWKIAGAEACATGKFFNLRRFTSSRFDEPSQGGGQLSYWYEESLVAFLRESDVLRLQRRGELSDASLANPFGQAILEKFVQEPGTAWLALGWKQFMYWFMDVESRIAEGRIDVPGMLQGAETMWLALEDAGVLMEEPRNNGSWLRPWRRAVSEYRL